MLFKEGQQSEKLDVTALSLEEGDTDKATCFSFLSYGIRTGACGVSGDCMCEEVNYD